MFYVAYTLDGQDAAKRPLTFAFNGGPGSASIWLHMGALGPRKVVLQPDGFMPPAPYRMEDNPYTLLDKSDLVLIDAIGTGFSRAADAEMFKKFWGVKGDIEAFSEFIRLYITRNERWASPLFLFGESYGTTRSAGIAGYLADRGISFNGITLLSTVLNFETLEDNFTNDQPYIFLIPSFTMIAGYHHKLAPDLAQDMNRARQQSEQWASTEYARALDKGDSLTPEERQKVIDQLARFTGLSKEVIDEANLRINVQKFTHYLLIDQKLRVGRLDGRYTGPDPNGLLDTPFYDPTGAATRASVYFGVQQLSAHGVGIQGRHAVQRARAARRAQRHVGLGIGGRGISRHGFGDAAGDREKSVSEDSGDGRLLRSGDAVLRRQLHGRPSQSAAEVSRQHFVRDVRCGTHGLSADGRTEEDEGRSGGIHGKGRSAVARIHGGIHERHLLLHDGCSPALFCFAGSARHWPRIPARRSLRPRFPAPRSFSRRRRCRGNVRRASFAVKRQPRSDRALIRMFPHFAAWSLTGETDRGLRYQDRSLDARPPDGMASCRASATADSPG